jgi:hypothetical protein
VVQGALGRGCSERLAGRHIANRRAANGAAESMLSGRRVDQAEASGVLNTLSELHRPILRAEVVEEG